LEVIQDTMYYNITITLGEGKDQQILTTTGFDSDARVVYPVITVEDLQQAGMTACNAEATVTIERIYFGRLVDAFGNPTLSICNNGISIQSCETVVNLSDQSAPFISLTPGIDTLIACDTTGLGQILDADVIDNCDDDLTITFTVEMQETDPCFATLGSPDTTKATVIFTAVDVCGNVGSKTKNYTIIRPNIVDQLVRTDDVVMACSDNINSISDVPGLAIGIFKDGQFTARDTLRLSIEEYVCGYILTKRSQFLPATD